MVSKRDNRLASKITITKQENHIFCKRDVVSPLHLVTPNSIKLVIELEEELADVVYMFCERGFPFTEDRLCTLAYELAVANKRTGFSPTKKKAGRYWLKGYLDRWPKLKKKNAKNLSIYWARCANPVIIGKFFDDLAKWIKDWKLEYKSFSIWNVDEMGVGDVPKERKVIGIKGIPASQTVADEKLTNSTVVTFASAGGLYMPPMVIFKCGKIEGKWRETAPSGMPWGTAKLATSTKTYLQSVGKNFVYFLKEKELLGNGQKVLLLLDSHKSHLFNLHFMQYMKKNGVEVCCFPPHCTHIIQPLDDTPFGNFKRVYQKELCEWNHKHLGARMTKVDWFRVLVPAFTQAMSPSCIQKGCENTGIYPVNPKVQKLKRLGPSIVTDRYSKCTVLDKHSNCLFQFLFWFLFWARKYKWENHTCIYQARFLYLS